MSRIGCIFVVGHSAASQGAVACDGTTEWTYHRQTAQDAAHALALMGHDAEARWRDASLVGAAGLRTLIASLNALAPRCVVELHHNSGPPARHGVEVLHWPGSVAGAALAAHLLREVAPLWSSLPAPTHRVIAQSRSWNGPAMTDSSGRPVPGGVELDILKLTKMPAVILETHYGSHAESQALAHRLARTGRLAECIARGVAAWLDTQR